MTKHFRYLQIWFIDPDNYAASRVFDSSHVINRFWSEHILWPKFAHVTEICTCDKCVKSLLKLLEPSITLPNYYSAGNRTQRQIEFAEIRDLLKAIRARKKAHLWLNRIECTRGRDFFDQAEIIGWDSVTTFCVCVCKWENLLIWMKTTGTGISQHSRGLYNNIGGMFEWHFGVSRKSFFCLYFYLVLHFKF